MYWHAEELNVLIELLKSQTFENWMEQEEEYRIWGDVLPSYFLLVLISKFRSIYISRKFKQHEQTPKESASKLFIPNPFYFI